MSNPSPRRRRIEADPYGRVSLFEADGLRPTMSAVTYWNIFTLCVKGGGLFVLRPEVNRKITNWAKGNINKYKDLKNTRWNRLKIKINEKIIT